MVRSYGDYTTNLLLELVRPFVSDCAEFWVARYLLEALFRDSPRRVRT